MTALVTEVRRKAIHSEPAHVVKIKITCIDKCYWAYIARNDKRYLRSLAMKETRKDYSTEYTLALNDRQFRDQLVTTSNSDYDLR